MFDMVWSSAKSKVIRFLIFIIGKVGVGITSYENLAKLRRQSQDGSRSTLEFIFASSPSNYEQMIPLLIKSKSDLKQDLFALSEANFKKEGYFVEFGATNGIFASNSYLLETEFSWSGILAEPGIIWKDQLQVNRPNASIETLCVWKDSNSTLIFNETEIPSLSTIESFSDKDNHKNTRRAGKKYEVQTISLNDLLIKHQAPKYIDYLSIDTEGSEYEILRAFDFSKFSFGVITVEHNYTNQRELIFTLLTRNGYKRKYEGISDYDDWYVRN